MPAHFCTPTLHYHHACLQVLGIDPAPLFEQSGRDGSKTECLMFSLMQAQLPPGWSLYSGARLLEVWTGGAEVVGAV